MSQPDWYRGSQRNTAATVAINLVLCQPVTGIFYLILSWLAERIFSDLATKKLYKLQTALFNHMQTLSLTFFDRQPLGQLLSRVTNDTEAVALFYEQAVAQIIRAIAQILMIVVVMFIADWRLAIAALLIVPVMLVLTSVIQRASTPAFAKMQENMGDLSGFQEETLSGHKVIISNRRQEWATEANQELAAGVFDVGSKAYFTSLYMSQFKGKGSEEGGEQPDTTDWIST